MEIFVTSDLMYKEKGVNMSKFCSNCGAKLNKDQDVCLKCGVNINKDETSSKPVDAKSKVAAGLLAIFFGTLGIHNFYLGYNKKAVVQLLLTVIGWIVIVGPIISGIWSIVEAIMLFTGSISVDASGKKLTD